MVRDGRGRGGGGEENKLIKRAANILAKYCGFYVECIICLFMFLLDLQSFLLLGF